MQNGPDAAEELGKSADAGLAFARAHIRVFFILTMAVQLSRVSIFPQG